jgi:thiosulfate/3-mercaptopyruvate sulfurtransferase
LKVPFQLLTAAELDTFLYQSEEGREAVVLEAHFSSWDHPLDGDVAVRRHLPGAIQIHPSYLEAGREVARYYPFYACPQDGNLLPYGQLVGELERLGIFPDRTVVVYGTEPDGPMAAARLTWGLLVAGVKSVIMLDGGVDAWVAYGGKTESWVKKAVSVADPFGSGSDSWRMRSDLVADTDEVETISRGREGAKLVDVRRSGEFDGTTKRNYSFFSKSGHVPGAILQGNWVGLVDSETGEITPMLESVRQRWKDLGIIDAKVENGEACLVFYCGTGWRSSLSFLVAMLLGYKAKNYDDGFYGWSWDSKRSIEFR